MGRKINHVKSQSHVEFQEFSRTLVQTPPEDLIHRTKKRTRVSNEVKRRGASSCYKHREDALCMYSYTHPLAPAAMGVEQQMWVKNARVFFSFFLFQTDRF